MSWHINYGKDNMNCIAYQLAHLVPLYLQVCIFVSTSACASVLVCVSWPSADCVFDTHHNGTILYHLLGNRNQTINKMCQFAKHFPRLHFALTKKARKKKNRNSSLKFELQRELAEFHNSQKVQAVQRERETKRYRGRERALFDRRLNGRTFREFQCEPGIHFNKGKPPAQSTQHPLVPGSIRPR